MKSLEGFGEILVPGGNGGLWERYAAMFDSEFPYFLTQDDDCIVDVDAVIAEYDKTFVTCNIPIAKRAEYTDSIALVGWGAVFHRSTLEVLKRYLERWPSDALFHREADRVFTGLNRLKLIDVKFEHLAKAHGKDRMGAQPDHLASLAAIRERIYKVRRGH